MFVQYNADTVRGTSWNVSGVDIVCPGSGLTPDEQLTSFNIAKNMYAGHTKLLWTMDKSVYDAADQNFRQKTICTTDSRFYCGSDVPCAGGVSYVGSFNTNTPDFVFTAALNYNVRNIGDAIGHEKGHSLGLYHAIDSCTQSYAPAATLCSDGIFRTKIMGADYSDKEHYFQTYIRCLNFGVPCMSKLNCGQVEEDQIIESHVRQN